LEAVRLNSWNQIETKRQQVDEGIKESLFIPGSKPQEAKNHSTDERRMRNGINLTLNSIRSVSSKGFLFDPLVALYVFLAHFFESFLDSFVDHAVAQFLEVAMIRSEELHQLHSQERDT
jgi:hypothetical protein